jgi:DAACS family dicarboxylate/amino acid:cation (Na+ or H+) symporter
MNDSKAKLERRRWPLHKRIVVGLVIGAGLGIAANLAASRLVQPDHDQRPSFLYWIVGDADGNGMIDFVDRLAGDIADPIGRVFLRLILMVIIPLVVSALILGVVEIGDVRRLGRVGVRTLVLTGVLSSIAVVLGVSLVNVLRPGHALAPQQRAHLQAQYSRGAEDTLASAKLARPLKQVLLDLIPENPLQEMVGAVDGSSKGNGMLAVMVFALVIGVAITVVPREKSEPVVRVLEGLYAVAMVVIGFAMWLAPVAVGCLVFAITARLGFDILRTLGWFALTVLLGLGVQLSLVYSLLVGTVARVRPTTFFRAIQEAMWTAFGTSSSSATLPTALRVAEQELRLPKEIGRFVLTVGATGNQNGTALFEGVVVLFLAQVFGVELTWAQQTLVVLMAVLAGVGTAGVPGGSLPMIVVVLQSVGIPGEGIGIILGIDRFLDMCRTVLNVTGDLVLATCVAQWEQRTATRHAQEFPSL